MKTQILQTFAVAILMMGTVLVDLSYIQLDFLFPDNLIVVDKEGKRTGYLKKDPLVKGQYRIEVRDGKTKGWIRADPLFKNRERERR